MPTNKELQEKLAAAEARANSLQQQLTTSNAPRPLNIKVGQKGGVCVTGLNARFPVTLYKQQWERLFDFIPQIKAFIKEHESELAVKA